MTQTDNPQVALYTVNMPSAGSVTIDYGKTTNYGMKTWTQSTSTGGPVNIFVAGMLANTTYHMRASVEFDNGNTVNDVDQSFTTGPLPSYAQPLVFQATTAAGMTPQPGLKLLDSTAYGLIITDLSGNILWTYHAPNVIQGVKMLPNGDFLMVIGANSSDLLSGPLPPGTDVEIREVNLGGYTVRSISLATLNAELANAGCAECNVTLTDFHHDVTALPNGHWMVLANTTQALSSTRTPALINAPPTTVLGDVIVDLDQYLQPHHRGAFQRRFFRRLVYSQGPGLPERGQSASTAGLGLAGHRAARPGGQHQFPVFRLCLPAVRLFDFQIGLFATSPRHP
ncbi:MAG: aryl-sulfate sulfotransferase, partial [Gammaproteobacteria bacterium]|nr:aryl-sulfate sulfotransferase [Gammaproteobacteria bacterium]